MESLVKGIKPINKDTVHKICSGQVVLSLAVAVKELVENSLDAGATNIEVRLKNYGTELIEVCDNGSGVTEENFTKLTLKYHTSKLNDYSDLLEVESFGFRGEALSSLCALANVVITTRHKSSEYATKIEYDLKGNITKRTPCSRQVGTTVSLTNLFHSLPVRQKEFHKNVKREFHKMTNLLYAYCLISLGVKITCTNQTASNSKSLVVATQGSQSYKDNIACVFGVKQLQSLMEIKTANITNIKDNIYKGLSGECSQELSENVEVQDIEINLSEDSNEAENPDESSITISQKSQGYKNFVNPVELIGFITSGSHGSGRSSTDRQYYYVNSRPCEPTKIIKLINEVYKQYNPHQYPFIFLNIIIDRNLVDVNLTPDKRKVLLTKEKIILDVIKHSLLKMFESIPRILKVESLTNLKRSLSDETIKAEINQPRIFNSFLQQFGKNNKSQINDTSKETQTKDLKRKSSSLLDSYIISKNKKYEDDLDNKELIDKKEFIMSSTPIDENIILEGYKIDDLNKNNEHENTEVFESDDTNLETNIHIKNNTESAEELLNNKQFVTLNEIIIKKECDDGLDIENEHDNIKALEVCKPNLETNTYTEDSILNKQKLITNNHYASLETNIIRKESDNDDLGICDENENTEELDTNEASLKTNISTNNKTGNSLNPNKIMYLEYTSQLPNTQIRDLSDFMGEQSYTTVCKNKSLQPKAKFNEVKVVSKPTKSIKTVTDRGDLGKSEKRFVTMKTSLEHVTEMSKIFNKNKTKPSDLERIKFKSTINPVFNKKCEEELTKEISKESFKKMIVIGQFNLGFIITKLEDDLFIIDQHATDEIYNFETLQKTTELTSQKLVIPQQLELTSLNEQILMDNLEIFRKNGFTFAINEDAPPTKKVKLLTLPMSKNWIFGKDDIDELLFMLRENPTEHCRPSRVRAMFASRACRKSVMIGMALSKADMKKLVDHMAEIDKPWNCPHGRPTIRHLVNLAMVHTQNSEEEGTNQ